MRLSSDVKRTTTPSEHLCISVRTGENAFKRVFGAPRFEYLKSNEEANESFQEGMKAITRGDISAILKAYDFSAFKTVVDVGGGNGALLSAYWNRTHIYPEYSSTRRRRSNWHALAAVASCPIAG
jgi:O-methyltransferase